MPTMNTNFHLEPHYLLAVLTIAMGGIPKGYDEGGFSASVTLPSFKNDFDLNKSQWKHDASGLASRISNITSFGVLGAAIGSLIALTLLDRLGRLRTYQLSILVWASGIVMQVFSSGLLGLMLFARIWGGLGSGALTVVCPLFLSEIAPAKSRGLIVSIYIVILLTFLSLGFFVNYAANVTMLATRTQYRIVQALPLIPVGFALFLSFFITDSPRWLASNDGREESLSAIARLRGRVPTNHQVVQEFAEIELLMQARAQDLQRVTTATIIKDIITIPAYRKRFLLVMLMQIVAQWSGGNGITYYIPQIFEYAGVSGNNSSLISSGAYGIVKLLFTMIFAWGLIDLIGRRRCFISGLSLQLAAHIYMAVYLSQGAVSAVTNNKSASDAAIASVFTYAVGWSIGLCTIQYIYGPELFPTRIRAVCYAASMALHWFFQFAVVKVTPNMFVSLNIWGAYVFWAVICALGLAVLGLWAPETKGVPMERMGELFEGRWWMGWKAKLGPAPNDVLQNEGQDGIQEEKFHSSIQQVESFVDRPSV